MKNITQKIPCATADVASYLQKNKKFVDSLVQKTNINSELEKYCAKQCPECQETVVAWPHKTKDSFLLTIGEIKKVNITVKMCPNCKILIYADLFDVGLIPVHNKENFSFLNGLLNASPAYFFRLAVERHSIQAGIDWRDYIGCFFYSKRSVAVAWTNLCPWSIVNINAASMLHIPSFAKPVLNN